MHCQEWPSQTRVLKDYATSPTNIEEIPVHQMIQIARASTQRLQEIEICEATQSDTTQQLLAQIVHDMKIGTKEYKTVHAVYSHIGTSEMRSHLKMEFLQIILILIMS